MVSLGANRLSKHDDYKDFKGDYYDDNIKEEK